MANFKVFFHSGETVDAKRFTVDADVVTSFIFMKEKLQTLFPNLRNNEFKITWKDAQGDDISISNDEDFMTAMTELSDESPKVLHVTLLEGERSRPTEQQVPRMQVVCDICNKAISGYRYKCIECPDYDLCNTCEQNGYHSEHFVLRLPSADVSFSRFDRRLMHNAAKVLKKTAKDAHRCGRDFAKHMAGGEREKKCGASTSQAAYEAASCPFSAAAAGAAEPIQNLIGQHLFPFLEALKNASGPTEANQASGEPTTNAEPQANVLGDIIKNTMEAFFGAPATNSNSNTSNKDASTSSQTPNVSVPTTPPSEPAQEKASSTEAAPQEMDWTIVQNAQEVPQVQTTEAPASAPAPPQDIRLMRGLAQLHEMGFSNENGFLTYHLERCNYNVAEVVKAIVDMK